jgi:hypothetical protein
LHFDHSSNQYRKLELYAMSSEKLTIDAELELLQREAFDYFLHETNPANGLVIDKTAPGFPASIAATGFALAAYPVAIDRGFMPRAVGLERTLAALRFFWSSPQGPELDASGYHGFYYHFLDMQTGRRAWQSELSTVDSAFLLAGMLAAAAYFTADSAEEREVRTLADALYRRANWQWAKNGGATLTHGWKPETGFLPFRWEGYDEALLLYVLALGSPTYSLSEDSYAAWLSTYQWLQCYGYDYLYAGSLFTHQLSHMWIDFRGIQDAYMRDKGIDYFENSRRATYVQQQYAIDNPQKFKRYGEHCWGITASDGPGAATISVDGIRRQFYGYLARGVPHGPDDGTVAPWAVVASLPFAPEIVLPAIDHFIYHIDLKSPDERGFQGTFNPTHPDRSRNPHGWVSPARIGINQGPIVLMIENYRSEMLWHLMHGCRYMTDGLRKAGFTGGWLSGLK